MKPAFVFGLVGVAVAACASLAPAQTFGTGVTYQGELRSGDEPVGVAMDFRFALFDAPAAGTQVGPTLEALNTRLELGRFAVILDFGAGAWTGEARYLEVRVRTAWDGSGSEPPFTTLSSRQPMTPSPAAIIARSAGDAALFGGQAPAFFRDASNLVAGLIPDERIGALVPRTDRPATFEAPVTMSHASNIFAGSFAGAHTGTFSGAYTGTFAGSGSFDGTHTGTFDGSGTISGTFSGAFNGTGSFAGTHTGTFSGTGTFDGAHTGTFNGTGTFSGAHTGTFTGTGSFDGTHTGTFNGTGTFGGVHTGEHTGAFAGDGALLTNLDASAISTGSLDEARLPPSLVRLAGDNVFTGVNTFMARVGIGTATPQYALQVAGASATAIYGLSTTETGPASGVLGECNSPSGYGVLGRATGSDVRGVFGDAPSSSGFGVGVYGQSRADGGAGVRGVALAFTGAASGVEAISASPGGRGLAAFATASAGATTGGLFQAVSTAGTGVLTRVTATSGVTYALRAQATSPDGWAGYFEGRTYLSPGVGIGTTTPAGPLHIVASGPPPVGQPPENGGLVLGAFSTQGFKWIQAYGGAMVLNPVGGAVGVNVTDPQATLHVAGATPKVVFGSNTSAMGQAAGVWGRSVSQQGAGVWGEDNSPGGAAAGVRGTTTGLGGAGVWGSSTVEGGSYGVRGSVTSPNGYAGYFEGGRNYFQGNVGIGTNNPGNALTVVGTMTASVKNFTIDHPTDAGRVLVHSSVESDEYKNLYDGTVELDGTGRAMIELPRWFEALNENFRYQVTCVGAWAPVYVARELEDGRFDIAGGSPGLKVCWQVTGTRKDAYAKAHPLVVEQDKPGTQ